MASVKQLIGAGYIAISLFGCSSIVSEQHPKVISDIATLEDKASGLVYMLPQRLAQLTVQRKPIPSDLNQKIATAKADIEAKKETVNKAETTLAETKNFLEALRTTAGANEDLIKKAEAAVITATAERTKAEAALKAANDRLAELEKLRDVLLTASQNGDPQKQIVTYDINLQLRPAQGDPAEVYVAKLAHYPWRDDTITLKTTEEGLLTTADANVVDRTSDILVNIASALAAFGVAPVPTVPKPRVVVPYDLRLVKKPPVCTTQLSLTLQWIFDPTAGDWQDDLNRSSYIAK
jgi:hypothetical protein